MLYAKDIIKIAKQSGMQSMKIAANFEIAASTPESMVFYSGDDATTSKFAQNVEAFIKQLPESKKPRIRPFFTGSDIPDSKYVKLGWDPEPPPLVRGESHSSEIRSLLDEATKNCSSSDYSCICKVFQMGGRNPINFKPSTLSPFSCP